MHLYRESFMKSHHTLQDRRRATEAKVIPRHTRQELRMHDSASILFSESQHKVIAITFEPENQGLHPGHNTTSLQPLFSSSCSVQTQYMLLTTEAAFTYEMAAKLKQNQTALLSMDSQCAVHPAMVGT